MAAPPDVTLAQLEGKFILVGTDKLFTPVCGYTVHG